MGSLQPFAGVAPQQELPPLLTRKAACPYFSLTTSLMFTPLAVFELIPTLLAADFNDLFRLHRFIASAALGIEELEHFLECIRICRVAQESAFPVNMDKVLRFQLIEMMRESGVWNLQLLLNRADRQAFRVGGQEQLYYPQSWLCSHVGEHVCLLG